MNVCALDVVARTPDFESLASSLELRGWEWDLLHAVDGKRNLGLVASELTIDHDAAINFVHEAIHRGLLGVATMSLEAYRMREPQMAIASAPQQTALTSTPVETPMLETSAPEKPAAISFSVADFDWNAPEESFEEPIDEPVAAVSEPPAPVKTVSAHIGGVHYDERFGVEHPDGPFAASHESPVSESETPAPAPAPAAGIAAAAATVASVSVAAFGAVADALTPSNHATAPVSEELPHAVEDPFAKHDAIEDPFAASATIAHPTEPAHAVEDPFAASDVFAPVEDPFAPKSVTEAATPVEHHAEPFAVSHEPEPVSATAPEFEPFAALPHEPEPVAAIAHESEPVAATHEWEPFAAAATHEPEPFAAAATHEPEPLVPAAYEPEPAPFAAATHDDHSHVAEAASEPIAMSFGEAPAIEEPAHHEAFSTNGHAAVEEPVEESAPGSISFSFSAEDPIETQGAMSHAPASDVHDAYEPVAGPEPAMATIPEPVFPEAKTIEHRENEPKALGETQSTFYEREAIDTDAGRDLELKAKTWKESLSWREQQQINEALENGKEKPGVIGSLLRALGVR